MRQSIKLETQDEHIIYGYLDEPEIKTDKLIIFVHGMSGSSDEHHYYNAVNFFNAEGFATYRINLYARANKGRQLSESSIATHVQDVNQVVEYFSKSYSQIYLVGHSLGCIAVIDAEHSKLKQIILWEPTVGFNDLAEKNATYDEATNKYILHWGLEFSVSAELFKVWKNFEPQNYINKVPANSIFIFGELSKYFAVWRPYLNNFNPVVIKGADHAFLGLEQERELFVTTLKLLQ